MIIDERGKGNDYNRNEGECNLLCDMYLQLPLDFPMGISYCITKRGKRPRNSSFVKGYGHVKKSEQVSQARQVREARSEGRALGKRSVHV